MPGADLLLAAGGFVLGAGVVWLVLRRGRLLGGGRTIPVIVTLAGVIGATADAAPTGRAGVDATLCAAFAALSTLAGWRASRSSGLVALGIVGVAAHDAGIAAAFAGLGACLVAIRARLTAGSSALIGAASGAAIGNVGLRLAWPDRLGATTAVAVLAVSIVAWSGARHLPRSARTRVLGAAALLVLTTVLVSLAALVPLWSSRAVAEQAIDAGDAAIAAARAGESADAAAYFDRAHDLLGGVRDDVEGWWAVPARAVPILAQHLDAAQVALRAGDDLARTGAAIAREVDIERVRPRGGRVDVEALASFEAPLERTAAVLDDVVLRLRALERRWLSGRLVDRIDDVTARIDRARDDNQRALRAAATLPGLLGAGGERRWFVAVVTPSELRGGGGLMGNWGILTATEGRLALPIFERVEALYLPPERTYALHVDDEWDARYVRRFHLAQYPQNVAASPHFPSTAIALRQIAEQAGFGHVDGVIQVDPYALAGLLRLTGPVTVDEWPEPITADNAAAVLLHRQYENAEDPNRPDFLEATGRTVFDALTTRDLPAPSEIADVLGPLVEQHRLQVHAFDTDQQTYLDELELESQLVAPAGDALGLVTHNAAPSKLDWFLRRSVRYEIDVDQATGEAIGTVEVRLRNEAPPGIAGSYFGFVAGGFETGQTRHMVSLYSLLPLEGLTVDGVPVTPDASRERGRHVHDTFVTVDAGAEVVLRYELRGTMATFDGSYRLDVTRQPTVAADDLVVIANGRTLFDGVLSTSLVVEGA